MALSKAEALDEIVNTARTYGLSAEEVASAISLGATSSLPSKETRSGAMARIFAYIGGILAVSGLGIYISSFWPEMGSAARVIITLGTGVVLFAVALIASSYDANNKVTTPLFILAGFLQPAGLYTLLYELDNGGDIRVANLIIFSVLTVQQVLTFKFKHYSTLLFFAICYGIIAYGSLFDLMDVSPRNVCMIVGFSLFMVCIGLNKTKYKDIVGLWFIVSSTMFLAAFFDLVVNRAYEISFFALGIFVTYISILLRSRSLLTVGTVSTICYIGYFSAENFADSVGWPVTLMIIGLLFVGISMFSMRLSKKYIR